MFLLLWASTLLLVGAGAASASARQRKTARELHPILLDRIRQLQESSGGSSDDLNLSPLASSAYKHLLELLLDADGNPNPRVTCTTGYQHATTYVANQLNRLGLTPMGQQSTYYQLIPNSIDEELCPVGMMNILGMVPGTEYPNEYIVYSAHLDGPLNMNPQTEQTRGESNTSNAYDNALAVAVGLAMAEELMQSPPARSVVFFFEDGEEGWSNLGVRKPGESQEELCQRLAQTKWYDRMYKLTGGYQNEKDQEECRSSYIGTNYWYDKCIWSKFSSHVSHSLSFGF